MIGLIHPPPSAPLAFRTLAESFAPMMKRVGVDVVRAVEDPIGLSRSSPREQYEILCYAWVPPLTAPPARRHIEIIVDGDLAPTLSGGERVFPSEAWRNFMWGKYQPRLPCLSTVIPNWVDPELWPLSQTTEDYFLFVGRIVPGKVGVLPELVQAFPDQRFKIAGEGIAGLIPALPNVEFLGHVEQPELARLMGRALAVLCPSQYCEPFGLAAVEAGLTGTLVIASDIGGFHETIPKESVLVDPFRIGDWVRALGSAIEGVGGYAHDRLLRRGWHDACHSPATIGLRYLELFERAAPEIVDAGKGVYTCG